MNCRERKEPNCVESPFTSVVASEQPGGEYGVKTFTIRREGAVTSAAKALSKIADRSVVALSGFNMVMTPEYLLLELMRLYKRTGHPRDLFLIADALSVTPGRALDKIGEEIYKTKDTGLIRGISMAFFGFTPWFQKLVADNMLEAYSWPMGVAAYWFREVASGRPVVISKIGLDTSIDPKEGGGRLNGLAEDRNTCRVRRMAVDGEDYLIYEAPNPDVALVRATTADSVGNLTMERELMRGTTLSIVQAAKAHPNPGMVVAQVLRVSKGMAADPRDVEVPGPFVDYVVVAPERYHWQAGTTMYDPRLTIGTREGLLAATGPSRTTIEPCEKFIARRILLELVKTLERKGAAIVANLGIGIPTAVSRLAFEEKLTEYIVTVLESGQWGGVALGGMDFGIALDPFALSTMPDMFSNFEGGVIDAAALGFLQVGPNGDVNPSMIPGRMYGPGGFPVIAGGSPRIYFAGKFTAGDSEIEVVNGKLRIVKDGKITKFVAKPYRTFFSGHQALRFGKEVLYVTERAVFKLTAGGLELTEIAPGVDLHRDLLSKMEFRPNVASEVKEMDERLFRRTPMRLARELR
jgi:acyl CoA:acetate/3-ketoacid CoA transferase